MLINGFNEEFKNIYSSYLNVGYDSMIGIHFQDTLEGGLLHLSYILCNAELLETEFKTATCSVTGDLIIIEIQIRTEGKNKSKYHMEIGSTSSCMKSIMEDTKRLGQRDVKGDMKDCFIFGSWF